MPPSTLPEFWPTAAVPPGALASVGLGGNGSPALAGGATCGLAPAPACCAWPPLEAGGQGFPATGAGRRLFVPAFDTCVTVTNAPNVITAARIARNRLLR